MGLRHAFRHIGPDKKLVTHESRKVGDCRMLNLILRAFVITLGLAGPAMAQERILISSDWGKINAELVDNNATRSLVQMLPLTIEMRDHLRQEKTGNLPSPLPAVERQLDFSTGTLGLWSSNHFVIYYRGGRVPQPGIILLGRVVGDVSIFDRPGPVSVRVERIR
jgi:hypothetical protein